MEKENIIPNISISSSSNESPRKFLDSPRKQNKLLNSGKKGSPAHKSPSRAPVSSKILFFEQNDANASNPPESSNHWYFPEIKEKIQFYEKLFMGAMKNSGKRDVVIKHDDWKKMINDLLSQVQAKENLLRDSEGRAEGAEEREKKSVMSLELSKAAYDSLNASLQSAHSEITRLNELVAKKAYEDGDSQEMKEMRERMEEMEATNKTLRDANKILEAQAAQDKHYSQCAEEKVEQLMVELIAEQDKNNEVQSELERSQAEIANLTTKLVSRNAELKLYKAKVESFLENLETRAATPTKKRMSICSDVSTSSTSSCPGSASKRARPSPAFTSPSPRFEYRFDPTRYEK